MSGHRAWLAGTWDLAPGFYAFVDDSRKEGRCRVFVRPCAPSSTRTSFAPGTSRPVTMLHRSAGPAVSFTHDRAGVGAGLSLDELRVANCSACFMIGEAHLDDAPQDGANPLCQGQRSSQRCASRMQDDRALVLAGDPSASCWYRLHCPPEVRTRPGCALSSPQSISTSIPLRRSVSVGRTG